MKRLIILMMLLTTPLYAQITPKPVVKLAPDFSSNGSIVFDKSYVGVNLDAISMIHFHPDAVAGNGGRIIIKVRGKENYSKILAEHGIFDKDRAGKLSETEVIELGDTYLKLNNKFLDKNSLRKPSKFIENQWELKLMFTVDETTFLTTQTAFQTWADGKLDYADSGNKLIKKPKGERKVVYETYVK